MVENDGELVIEITSDFICPWCYVGDTRLEKALREVAPHMKVKRRWRPFELNPAMPEGGMDRKAYLSQKFGGEKKLKEIDERLKAVGAGDGLNFRSDLIGKAPNTLKAHRLMWLAAQEDRADELANLIFKAYFTEGKDIGDSGILTVLAVAAGMDEGKARAFLATEEGADDIRRMEEEAYARGINRVPFTVIGDEKLEGALADEDIVGILRQILERRKAA